MTEEPAGTLSPHLLSTAPATESQKRVRLAVVIVSLLIFVGGLPFVRIPLPVVTSFIPAYEGALWIIDVVTAALLFGQFIQVRSRALLVLGAGYTFDALIVVAHALSFPGAFSPTGLLGARPQTTAWLYEFWHGGFPMFVLVYALLPRGKADPLSVDPVRAISLVLAASLVLVIALTLLATAGHDHLPVIIQDHDYTLGVRMGVGPAVFALTALALAALWLRSQPTSLDVWLSVVFVAWILDIAFSAVLGAHRFDFGFYAGRLYGFIAASFVLVMLLIETYRLYGRFAEALATAESRYGELVKSREEFARMQRFEAMGQAIAGIAHDSEQHPYRHFRKPRELDARSIPARPASAMVAKLASGGGTRRANEPKAPRLCPPRGLEAEHAQSE